MSDKVKRYMWTKYKMSLAEKTDIEHFGIQWGYVSHEDYARLVERVKELEVALNKMMQIYDEEDFCNDSLVDEARQALKKAGYLK